MTKKRSAGNTKKKNVVHNAGENQTSKERNGQQSGTKAIGKRKSSESSSSHMYMFYIGLSIVFVAAAIVFINEDVQLYLVKLIQTGSDSLGTVLRSANEEGKYTQNEQNTVHTQTSQKEQSSLDTVIQSEADIKENKAHVVKSEGKTETTQTEAEIDDQQKPQKKKVTREEYEKHEITCKEDFKIWKKLDAAELLLDKGDADGAIAKYDAILKSYPNSPRALWGKGLAVDMLAEKRRSNSLLEDAMKLMDTALRLPATPEPLLTKIATKLAQRQAFRGWSHKESQTWKYLITKFPDNLDFKRKYGVSFLMMGKIEDARNVFKEILVKDPDDGFSLAHLGFILKTNDLKYKEAIPLMQRGIDSKAPGTSDGRFYYHLGDAYQRLNQTDRAMELYQQAADLGLFLSRDQRSLYNAATKLTSRPWWTPEQTPYKKKLRLLENNWETIRDEGLAQLDKKTGSFLPEEENLRETGDWKQFTLFQRGRKNEDNCRKVPKTCALLDQIPDATGCTRGQIKYSVMHAGVHVWPHTGPTNCRIRAHLGLKVPKGPRIRVGNETKTWKEGKFIIIDDSFEHEVWHDGTELRLILIVDFWHPDIPEHERRTLSPI